MGVQPVGRGQQIPYSHLLGSLTSGGIADSMLVRGNTALNSKGGAFVVRGGSSAAAASSPACSMVLQLERKLCSCSTGTTAGHHASVEYCSKRRPLKVLDESGVEGAGGVVTVVVAQQQLHQAQLQPQAGTRLRLPQALPQLLEGAQLLLQHRQLQHLEGGQLPLQHPLLLRPGGSLQLLQPALLRQAGDCLPGLLSSFNQSALPCGSSASSCADSDSMSCS